MPVVGLEIAARWVEVMAGILVPVGAVLPLGGKVIVDVWACSVLPAAIRTTAMRSFFIVLGM